MPGHRARKRFGQHFLTDPGVVDAILRAVHATKDDIVVEIGPGQGAITAALAASAGHLHAVELDRNLVYRLRRQYEGALNVTIHEADALAFDFSSLGDRLRIVGNLPYNISTPLLFHLLKYWIYIMKYCMPKTVTQSVYYTQSHDTTQKTLIPGKGN